MADLACIVVPGLVRRLPCAMAWLHESSIRARGRSDAERDAASRADRILPVGIKYVILSSTRDEAEAIAEAFARKVDGWENAPAKEHVVCLPAVAWRDRPPEGDEWDTLLGRLFEARALALR